MPLASDDSSRRDPIAAYRRTLLGSLDQRFLSHSSGRWMIAGVVLVALIVPSIQFTTRIRKVDKSIFREAGERHQTALGRWLPDAKALAAGEDPYGYGHWFPTPPVVLMCLVPLSKIGYTGAAIVWSVLKLGGLAISATLLLQSLARAGMPIPTGVLIMAAAFGIRPIIADIQHGNLNIFMMIWIILTWACFLNGRDLAAGLFLALAIVTKVTPALLLLYFIYKRHWRVCLGASVGLTLFVVLVPSAYLGFGRNIALLRSWFDMLVAPYALHGWVTLETANQSLYGTLLRVLSRAGLLPVEEMPAAQAFAAGMEEMARPTSMLGQLLRPGVSLVIMGLLAWLCRMRNSARGDPRRLLELAAILLAMLLLGERTWKHHATTLPLVYLAMWYGLTCVHWSSSVRGAFVAALGAQFLLLVVAGEGVLGDHLAERLLDGGIFCWGVLLAFVQVAAMLFAIRVGSDAPRLGRAQG